MKIIPKQLCMGLTLFSVLIAGCGNISGKPEEPSANFLFEGQPVVLLSEVDGVLMIPEEAIKDQTLSRLSHPAQLSKAKNSKASDDVKTQNKDVHLEQFYQVDLVGTFELYHLDVQCGGCAGGTNPPVPKSFGSQIFLIRPPAPK